MIATKSNECLPFSLPAWYQVRIWHLALLVVLVALATFDIQAYNPRTPALLVVAATGYLGYFVMVWLCWLYARRFQRSLGLALLLVLFTTAMAALYMAAEVIYLVVESVYLRG